LPAVVGCPRAVRSRAGRVCPRWRQRSAASAGSARCCRAARQRHAFAPDRAVSAAAYVLARREGLPEAADLLAGRIKVDAVPSTYLPHNWHAMYAAEGGTTKGDTVYLPSMLDVSTLEGQASIIHELQHAADDRALKSIAKVYDYPVDTVGVRGGLHGESALD
jgi:hypothetical protein